MRITDLVITVIIAAVALLVVGNIASSCKENKIRKDQDKKTRENVTKEAKKHVADEKNKRKVKVEKIQKRIDLRDKALLKKKTPKEKSEEIFKSWERK